MKTRQSQCQNWPAHLFHKIFPTRLPGPFQDKSWYFCLNFSPPRSKTTKKRHYNLRPFRDSATKRSNSTETENKEEQAPNTHADCSIIDDVIPPFPNDVTGRKAHVSRVCRRAARPEVKKRGRGWPGKKDASVLSGSASEKRSFYRNYGREGVGGEN